VLNEAYLWWEPVETKPCIARSVSHGVSAGSSTKGSLNTCRYLPLSRITKKQNRHCAWVWPSTQSHQLSNIRGVDRRPPQGPKSPTCPPGAFAWPVAVFLGNLSTILWPFSNAVVGHLKYPDADRDRGCRASGSVVIRKRRRPCDQSFTVPQLGTAFTTVVKGRASSAEFSLNRTRIFESRRPRKLPGSTPR
jgi:hypothetical protein